MRERVRNRRREDKKFESVGELSRLNAAQTDLLK